MKAEEMKYYNKMLGALNIKAQDYYSPTQKRSNQPWYNAEE